MNPGGFLCTSHVNHTSKYHPLKCFANYSIRSDKSKFETLLINISQTKARSSHSLRSHQESRLSPIPGSGLLKIDATRFLRVPSARSYCWLSSPLALHLQSLTSNITLSKSHEPDRNGKNTRGTWRATGTYRGSITFCYTPAGTFPRIPDVSRPRG